MLVYLSRRNRTETAVDDDAVLLFVKPLNAWLNIDFNYHSMIKDVKSFPVCGVKTMCSVVLLMMSCSLDVTEMYC